MHDDLNHKVISIFQRHRRGEAPPIDAEDAGELIHSPDGFTYVSLKHDQEGLTEETSLIEVAHSKHYMIKMMEVHHESHTIRLNNYCIPGDRLEEFLLSLPTRPGKILEIRQFIPDGMA